MKRMTCAASYLIAAIVLFAGCAKQSAEQSVEQTVQDTGFALIAQDSTSIRFPDGLRGKTLVVGFIYTHCAGVCEIITSTMKRIAHQIQDTNIVFVELTFDPERDTPSHLLEYAALHGLDEAVKNGRWMFLTGNTHIVDSLMQRYDIITQKTYTTLTETGEKVYFIDHTDRICLIDARGGVCKEYEGSSVEPETVRDALKHIASNQPY